MFLRRIFIISILFFITCTTYTQIIPFKNYSVKDGLPSNIINNIVQDNFGYLWFATQAGLVMFDGYNFHTYKTEDGLPDVQINTILVDHTGKIWCGTENGGLFYVWNEKVYLFEDNKSLPREAILDLFIDKENRIWCATFSSVVYIKNNKVFPINSPEATINNEILCHLVDSKGNIWLSNIDGLYKYDSVLTKSNWNWCKQNIIRDILEDKAGGIWYASQEKGVICILNGKTREYSVQNGLSSNIVMSLFEANTGEIYAGTYNKGINIISDYTIQKERRLNTETHEIKDFHQDAFGHIWIKTAESGVYLLNENIFAHYTKDNGLADNMITCIFEDRNNNVWFSTYNGGISKYGKVVFSIYRDHLAGTDQNILAVEPFNDDILIGSFSGLTWFKGNKVFKTITNSNGLPHQPIVASIKSVDETTVWLGTNSGLTEIKKNKLKHIPDSVWYSFFYDYWASSIANKGKFVFAATGKGLIIFDGTRYKIKTSLDGLPSSYLYSVNIDKKGNIWCGTDYGLSIWDGKTFYNYGVSQGLPNEVINDIAIDYRGVGWLATDNGISMVSLSDNYTLSTKNISVADGLSSSIIYSVLPDSNNNVWIGHNKGLDCYNTQTKKIKQYGVLEGFLPVETNMGAICMDSHKNIWIGTVEGVVKYSPDNDYINKQAPIIYIKKVSLYNDTTSLSNYSTGIDSVSLLPANLKLPYSKNNLIFDFVGLQYTIVEKNRYKFRLKGYEENWSEPTADIQTPPYRKLPPGKYVFQILAANCDGIWTEKPTEFAFQILPPWWKTWWAKILEFSFAILSFFLIIFLRERKLRNDKKVLTQKVKERTIEIEKQKDQIEQQRDEITHQKEEITDSIIYARRIQSAILPKDETIQPILREYFILYKPRNIVSGDFYWIYGKNNKAIVIVADCTGHGVPGAFMSMLGVTTLNEIATRNDSITAAQILVILREHIIKTLSHTKKDEEARDGMDISLCIIDYNTLQAQFSGAFNPLIIVRNGEAEIIKADKMPVGTHIGELKPFTNNDIQLQNGDCLYMFSDGYADQFGGPDCKKFKSANMRALLCEVSAKTMDEQKQILDNTIENWKGETEQIDDILVMGIRV